MLSWCDSTKQLLFPHKSLSQSITKWIEVDQMTLKWTKWIELDQIGPNRMDWSGTNRLKWIEIDRKWTKVDRSRSKCYADVTQQERSNNKCYISIFRYYIDVDVDMVDLKWSTKSDRSIQIEVGRKYLQLTIDHFNMWNWVCPWSYCFICAMTY